LGSCCGLNISTACQNRTIRAESSDMLTTASGKVGRVPLPLALFAPPRVPPAHFICRITAGNDMNAIASAVADYQDHYQIGGYRSGCGIRQNGSRSLATSMAASSRWNRTNPSRNAMNGAIVTLRGFIRPRHDREEPADMVHPGRRQEARHQLPVSVGFGERRGRVG